MVVVKLGILILTAFIIKYCILITPLIIKSLSIQTIAYFLIKIYLLLVCSFEKNKFFTFCKQTNVDMIKKKDITIILLHNTKFYYISTHQQSKICLQICTVYNLYIYHKFDEALPSYLIYSLKILTRSSRKFGTEDLK